MTGELAFDTLIGDFRVHYAGFFDPGFGHPDARREGSRAFSKFEPLKFRS